MTQYTTSLVTFRSTDNLQLPGLLFTPQQPTKKAAIYLHGNGSASVFYSVKRAHNLAQAFAKKGVALLLFNNRGAHLIKKLTRLDGQGNQLEDVQLGTTYELIEDCVHDIDGAVNFLKSSQYEQLFLVGHSTGANKICVFDYYQPNNDFVGYVLMAGGDDTGLMYQSINDKNAFFSYVEEAQGKIAAGKGRELVPQHISHWLLSYQSFFDIANPDGNYNCFPFLEFLNEWQFSTLPLFRYFKAITKPSLVIYGENDEFAPEKSGQKALEILRQQAQGKNNYQFDLIVDSDHSFHGHEDTLGELVVDWIDSI